MPGRGAGGGAGVPGLHGEPVGFVHQPLLQARPVGPHPAGVAALRHQHPERTLGDPHLVTQHPDHMHPWGRERERERERARERIYVSSIYVSSIYSINSIYVSSIYSINVSSIYVSSIYVSSIYSINSIYVSSIYVSSIP